MRGASEELQNATVKAIFKPIFFSCLVVAVILQACLWVWPELHDLLRDWAPGRTRGLFFFGIVYTTIVPYFGFQLVRKHPVGWNPGVSTARKIFSSIFAWILFPVLMLLPVLVLLDPYPSGKLATFQLVLSQFLGLALLGSFWSYASCLILWVLISCFLLWRRN